MNKTEKYFFKKNCIEQVWWWANTGWVTELLHFPLIYFLKKFKCGEKLHKRYLKARFFFTHKPVLPIAEYIVTTRCTLNCKHCNSFMPKFKKETHTDITTFDVFKKDLDTLLEAIDYMGFLGFVGGEATLSKDLAKMIKYACSKKQIHQVFLTTNATILPTEEMLEALKHKKVGVQLSDYSHVEIKNGTTVKYKEYKELLIKHGIRFNNYQEKREAVTWFSMPKIYKDKQDDKKMITQYRNCVQTCNVICDGKILPCTAGPHIYRNLETTKEIQEQAVDLRIKRTPKELTNEIIKYFSRPNPAFCHYCHFENIQTNLPCGEQLEENHKESNCAATQD